MANIYWFTGHPDIDKSALATLLKDFLSTEKRNWRSKVFHIDSSYFETNPKTELSEYNLTELMVDYIHSSGCDVVVSVNEIDRSKFDDLKKRLGGSLIEFNLTSNTKMVGKLPKIQPSEYFLSVDMSKGNINSAFTKIVHYLTK